MIGEAAEPRLGDRDGAVVRRGQRADRDAEAERHPARDDADRPAAVPALDARDEHVVIRTEEPASAGHMREKACDRAALERRPETDDMAARQIAHAARRFEREDAAKTVPDEMHAPGSSSAHARAQALARRRGVAEHARIVEYLDRVAGRAEPSREREQREPAHPDAVKEDHVLGHGPIVRASRRAHAVSRARARTSGAGSGLHRRFSSSPPERCARAARRAVRRPPSTARRS